MGTNYYLEENPPCEHCGRSYERLHIGKSSAGWCFSLHVIPEAGLNSLTDWKALWSKPGAVIWDEYGEQISPTDMLKTITERKWPNHNGQSGAWMEMNEAAPGPNGLARHRIGRFCIGHGDGTYDLVSGEFS